MSADSLMILLLTSAHIPDWSEAFSRILGTPVRPHRLGPDSSRAQQLDVSRQTCVHGLVGCVAA